MPIVMLQRKDVVILSNNTISHVNVMLINHSMSNQPNLDKVHR